MRTRSSQHVFKRLSIGRRSLRWGGLGIALVAPLMTAAPASAAPFVYVTESPADIVSANDATSGSLLPLPHDQTTGTNPIGVAVTPDGTSVYVANFGDGKTFGSVSEYDVAADGTLTPKTAGPVRAGRGSAGIAVNPDGKAAYVADLEDGAVSQYDIGPGGVLSPTIPGTVAAGIGPRRIAVSPNGKSVYVTDRDKLLQYSVGAGDKLTPKTPATVATGNGPGQVAVSPDGKSAYVLNFFDGTVSQYNVGSDGALHPKNPATVATGNQPSGIAISPDSQSVYVANGSSDWAERSRNTRRPPTGSCSRPPRRSPPGSARIRSWSAQPETTSTQPTESATRCGSTAAATARER